MSPKTKQNLNLAAEVEKYLWILFVNKEFDLVAERVFF